MADIPSYVPAAYRDWVTQAAAGTGLDVRVVAAQIEMESGFNPKATSPTGAQGIAQFEPGTWKSYGKGSAYDPANALPAYIGLMSALLKQFNGDVTKALEAYNAGPGNLSAGAGYARKILANAKAGAAGATAGKGTGTGGSTGGGTVASGESSAALAGIGTGVEGLLNQMAPGTNLGTMIGGLLSTPSTLWTDLISPLIAMIPHVFAILTDLLKMMEWVVNPVSWVRMGAGAVGTVLLLLGLHMVTTAA